MIHNKVHTYTLDVFRLFTLSDTDTYTLGVLRSFTTGDTLAI